MDADASLLQRAQDWPKPSQILISPDKCLLWLHERLTINSIGSNEAAVNDSKSSNLREPVGAKSTNVSPASERGLGPGRH